MGGKSSGGAGALAYRREIDGLRALAVLPVILFHAGYDAFAGGYVGVDVFFVVSGYLITSIILADARAGVFSIAKFYERRIRRILPALLLVLAVTFPLALVFLLPGDMAQFSRSLVAVPLFVSNILFWTESGYFVNAVHLKPLIHTWSLAVEEQFYLFYPPLLIILWRLLRGRAVAIIALGALASLCLAQWAAFHKPEANFYLLPTRAWELGIGAVAAFHLARRERAAIPRMAGEVASLVGLGLIAYAVFKFDNFTPFPSLYALAPTAGAALIILFATPATAVGKLLSIPPLVGLGLISYSAYLWHQPLFAFARHRSLDEPSSTAYAILALLAIALAALSWRFVEQPFRRSSFLSRRRVFLAALAGSSCVAALGAVGVATKGYFFRGGLAAEVGEYEERAAINQGLGAKCDAWFEGAPLCSTDKAPTILLWGDSYAMHLMQGILASNPEAKIAQITVSMCGPLLGAGPIDRDYPRAFALQCIEHNDRVLEWLKGADSITHVVLATEYSQYSAAHGKFLPRRGKALSGGADAYPYYSATAKAVTDLGKIPVIVSPTPQDGRNLGRCLLKAKRFNVAPSECDFPLEDWRIARPHVASLMARLKEDYATIDLSDAICSDGVCRVFDGDTPLYRDIGHLAPEGSAIVGERLDLYRRIIDAKPPR